jgi:hypothetical protein
MTANLVLLGDDIRETDDYSPPNGYGVGKRRGCLEMSGRRRCDDMRCDDARGGTINKPR